MPKKETIFKEAMLYDQLEDKGVQCNLCAHRCIIQEDKHGLCQVRLNEGGTLYTQVYGRTITQNVDPIEKKPLFHFYPGTFAYSIATPGCNFRCGWCQNAEISQMPRERHLLQGEIATPDQIVSYAKRSGCHSIAYTYTEPTIYFEYAYDTAKVANTAGIANVFVTNGFMTKEMLDTIHPCLDAANVDLKAFKEETYRRYIGARLQPVLDNLRIMKQQGIWLEVTTLVIPGINDSDDELQDLANFVVQELGQETPWHINAFHPAYKMTNIPRTSVPTLQKAKAIGQDSGLRNIYMGNIMEETNTECHACHSVLIRRSGFVGTRNRITQEGKCPECGTPVDGVGMNQVQSK